MHVLAWFRKSGGIWLRRNMPRMKARSTDLRDIVSWKISAILWQGFWQL
jgi:hypothetical protein